ncbi:Flavo-diiron protein FprA2 [[Clostridium] cellulosi]|uniref:Flavo-diiron protein FprA2 n=1 Tax=[Clostridium] cellulosi TaxID=29343 RepID=A0A078KSG7_9FIRM|nr:Flavo-diiron protein FprA2 [[Clostridium] cellulosi]
MSAIKIKDGIYSVGVLNPNMRIFDVIMRTDYGTSYNSYLVKGEKTALIETVHSKFFEEYIDNIKSVAELSSIDYVIMNHNEPDHSGSLVKLIEAVPDIKIITSKAGSIYLKHITGKKDIEVISVKDGDTLDLGGGKVLKFISAPFLHWPDSIFTWLENDKVVFTCDFLGCHYCEPGMFDSFVKYPKRFLDAFKLYYEAIFSPFKPYVLSGLEKLSALDAEYVCTSHGPILQKNGFLEKAKEYYLKWSTPEKRDNKLIPIFYCSAYGNTEKLAQSIKEGIKDVEKTADVETYDLNEADFDTCAKLINNCDAFLIGSPTINRDAVRPIWVLTASIDAINSKGKPCAVFGSFGWSGEAVPMITERLKSLKFKVFDQNFTCQFVPTNEVLQKAREFGQSFAETLK